MIEHMVLFQAKPAMHAQLEDVLGTFVRDIVEYPDIHEAAAGPNVNRGALDRGWTHLLLVRLTDLEALSRYWNYPPHIVLLDQLGDVCDDRFGVDLDIPNPTTMEMQ